MAAMNGKERHEGLEPLQHATYNTQHTLTIRIGSRVCFEFAIGTTLAFSGSTEISAKSASFTVQTH
jgi:hypothetical protein